MSLAVRIIRALAGMDALPVSVAERDCGDSRSRGLLWLK
jgi:hypothetical protein